MSIEASTAEYIISNVHLDVLRQAETALFFVKQGVDETQVPNKDIQIAFACLGDHDRKAVRAEIETFWTALIERGLVFGQPSAYSTPTLRLILVLAPHLMALSDLNTRLSHGPFLPAPSTVFRASVKNTDLIWGDPVRIDFELNGVDYVRITPDEIFGRQMVLRRIQGKSETRFIELPGDDGNVVFTMLGRDGRIYGHTIELRLQDLDTFDDRSTS